MAKMDITERLAEYVTLPLIGRGHRGRLIQAAMRDAKAEIEKLREALGPFNKWYQLNDCHEMREDDTIEVPVRDLERAAMVLNGTAVSKGTGA